MPSCNGVSKPKGEQGAENHLQRVNKGAGHIQGQEISIDVVTTARFTKEVEPLLRYGLGGSQPNQNAGNDANLQSKPVQKRAVRQDNQVPERPDDLVTILTLAA